MKTPLWKRPSVLRIAYSALLVAIAVLLWSARAGLVSIWKEHLWTFLGVGLIMSLGLWVQVKNFLQLLEWPSHLAVRPAVHAWSLATLLNYLGPFQPGLALRLAYFKSQGVPMARTVGTTLRQLHLSFWTALLSASVAMFLLGGRNHFVAGAILLLAFLAWPRLLGALRPWLLGFRYPAIVQRHMASIEIVLTPLPMRSLKYFFLQNGLGAVLIFFTYHSFGSYISAGAALLITVGVYMASFVAILPNNLGILDGFYIATAQGGGLTLQSAVALAVLLRMAHVAMCVLMAVCTWRPGPATTTTA